MSEPECGHNTPENIAASSAGRVSIDGGSHRINRDSRQARWMGLSVSGSLVLHAFMFYLMSLPVLQITAVSLAPNPDFFWLSPFFLPGDKEGDQPQQQMSAPETVPVKAPFSRQTRQPAASESVNVPEVKGEPVPDDASREPAEAEMVLVRQRSPVAKKELPAIKHQPAPVNPAPRSAAPETSSAQPSTAKPEPISSRSEPSEMPAEMPMPQQEAKPLVAPEVARQDEAAAAAKHQAEQARAEQLAKEQAEQVRREQELQRQQAAEQSRLAQEKVERERATTEKARLAQLQLERDRAARESFEREQRLAEQRRVAQERAEHERKAAEAARQERLAREQAERERMAAVQRERLKATAEGAGKGVAKPVDKSMAASQLKPANAQASKQTASKAEKPKGLAIPTLQGDLKLVVSGTPPGSVRMAFREFGLKRRNRPFSRGESRNEVMVTPVVVATQENVREYVVARTGDGVYSMTLELDDQGGNSRFAVMLYDGSARKQKKVLDTGSVRNRRIQVRVLMPDGIFWDDESAFTGTMEDSDSVTKFNAETGLVWKEFNND